MGYIDYAIIENGKLMVKSSPSGANVEYYEVFADGVRIGINTESGGSPSGMGKYWDIPLGAKQMCAVGDNKVCVDVSAVSGSAGGTGGTGGTTGETAGDKGSSDILWLLGIAALGYIIFTQGNNK